MSMTEELATVGTAGASALITAMTTDGWRGVRAWVGRWLGRGHAEEETRHLVLFDRDRERLLAAPGEEGDWAQRLVAAWAVRLQDVADMDQEAAKELLDWVNRWRAENPNVKLRGAVVRQNAKASGRARITQVGGNQTFAPPERS